jgi:hypothetical protein
MVRTALNACGRAYDVQYNVLWMRRALEAAIASGELVPASAVAEMKSDLDALASEYAEISRIVGRQGNEEHSLSDHVRAIIASAVAAERELCAKVADDYTPAKFDGTLAAHVTGTKIAAAIRALEPASGEFVLVPREPTQEMIEAGDDLVPVARGTETYTMARGRKGYPEDIYRAMLTAATSNGSGK